MSNYSTPPLNLVVILLNLFLMFFSWGCGKSPFWPKPEIDADIALPSGAGGGSGGGQFQELQVITRDDFEITLKVNFVEPLRIRKRLKAVLTITSQDPVKFTQNPPLLTLNDCKLWMPDPSMNHGSDVIRVVKDPSSPADRLDFQLSNILFTMKGHWELRIVMTIDGRLLEQTFHYYL